MIPNFELVGVFQCARVSRRELNTPGSEKMSRHSVPGGNVPALLACLDNREQGVSKSGNPRLRTTMVQAAWLWLRYQPGSTLSRWYQERVSPAMLPRTMSKLT